MNRLPLLTVFRRMYGYALGGEAEKPCLDWRTGGVALYLFICLGFFTALGKLVLATYQIEYYPLLPTVIGTLALAKVVVLLDMTPVTLRLETTHPIWMATLYKTLFYCAVSAPVGILERVWHPRREAGCLEGSG